MTDLNEVVGSPTQPEHSASWDQFLDAQLQRLEEIEATKVERSALYPSSFEAYSELPTTERLSAAKRILIYEAPTVGRGQQAMPKNALRFDMSVMGGSKADAIEAQIAYAAGDWVNAINDTYVTEQAHVKIYLSTTKDGHTVTDQFARLVCDDWHEERFYAKGQTDDADSNLLNDVVMIIDHGIEKLYAQKLTARTRKLGMLAHRAQ